VIAKNVVRLVLIVVLVLTLGGAASARSRQADSTTLQVYFEGTQAAFAGLPPADRQVVADFTHDTGQPARAVPSQDPVKILASIEAGNAPDVVMLGYVRPSWLQQGAVLPLDGYMKASHFDLHKFTTAAWNQGYMNGHYYTMTSEQDSLVLLYNKDLFKKAGLDPNKPPQTISQLASYARKLTIVNRDGSIKQLGLMPNYNLGGGGANYFQLWGNVFGGQWYDPAHKKVTAEDPHNVQALTWLANFWKTYGPSRLDRFEAGFGTYLGPNDPFARGKIGHADRRRLVAVLRAQGLPPGRWVPPVPRRPSRASAHLRRVRRRDAYPQGIAPPRPRLEVHQLVHEQRTRAAQP
jgi:ABC-type glycerol-3-phosphate transport system substrate-binding protein